MKRATVQYVVIGLAIVAVIVFAGWENVYGVVRPYLSPMLRGG